jgi:hypothetical protein
MIQKPKHFAQVNAAAFKDDGVVDAYRHRPPYPPGVFDILLRLVRSESRLILDAGYGTGNLARPLVPHDVVPAIA